MKSVYTLGQTMALENSGTPFKNYLLLTVYNLSLALHINTYLIELLNEQLELLQLLQD
jgi:hypothetical protein